MEWFEELDFDENPLYIETKYHGNEELLNEAFYIIESGNILVIEGEEGSGKTKVLKEVIRKFGGKGEIAFIDCKDLEKELNVEKVIINKNGLLGWLFKKSPKNMILLLDNVEYLSNRNMERIKYFYDSNHLKAVIITTKEADKLKLNESIAQRIRKVAKVKPLTEFEAVQVVRDKLGENLLSDRIIKESYKNSNKNMKKFLENTEKVCKVYVENRNINEEDVRKLFERGGK
jgi:type II secretory pathway predicted ATPase ExeA